jgi:hypothetical protein
MTAENLATSLDQNKQTDITLRIKKPNTTTNAVVYTMKGARLSSESFNSSLGSNKTVDLTFVTQVGGPNDINNGIFVSGIGTGTTFIDSLIFSQIGSDIDGEAASDNSGYSVSMNAAGNIVAIGAYGNDDAGSLAGHTRIYQLSGTTWTQMGSDIDGEAAGDRSGYSVSMNDAGDRVAIGAPYNDEVGSLAGHTRIYQWNGTTWTKMGSDINGEAAGDNSGYSVSMNAAGDRVAIGAIYNNSNDSGHTRIYQWSGTTWTQMGSDINGEAADDRSGYSVSMNAAGDRVAIGAPYNDEVGSLAGHTRIYQWNGTTWTQIGSDINGEAAGDRSGWSVSMNAAGDRVAIGAPDNNDGGLESGNIRIYQLSGGTWTQMGSDIYGEAADDNSGWSVSMNAAGDRVAIGAPYNNGNGPDSGHTRIYQLNGSAWTQMDLDINGEAESDLSGYSVSMNAAGDRVAIGAIYNDDADNFAGHVRVYQLSPAL